MNAKELSDEFSALIEDLETMGDLTDADSETLRDMYNTLGKIITALEGDKELAEKTLEYKLDLRTLKELAVACYKAIPYRKGLESVLDSIDVYEYLDMAESMIHKLS